MNSPSSPPASPVDLGTFLDPNWDAVVPLLIPIVVAVLASNALAQLLVNWLKRGSNRKEKRREDSSEALAALSDYRTVVLKYGNVAKPKVSDPVRDTELATLGSSLVIACAKSPQGIARTKAEAYLEVAERFAAQDPLLGTTEEVTLFRELLDQIVETRNKQL